MCDASPCPAADSGPQLPNNHPSTAPEPDDAFIDATVAYWGPYYGRLITRSEAREIAGNAIGFFATLIECWTRIHGMSGATCTSGNSPAIISSFGPSQEDDYRFDGQSS